MKSTRILGALALAAGLGAPAAPLFAQERPANWWQTEAVQGRGYPGTAAERAYRELLAGLQPKRTVVVAIIDSGVDIEHPDLDGNVWKNEDEVPGNGRDDDRNGYVDDVHGWNFIGGAGGRNVNHDSYEITRLYVGLRTRCEGAGASAQAGCAEYPELKREFEERRSEAQQTLQQIQGIQAFMGEAETLLRQATGADSLTVAKVQALRPMTPQLQQAQEGWLQLTAAGLDAQELADALEAYQGQVQYGYNPDFDPRSIVGDNYADLNQRGYGNADVEGPDAEHGTHVAGIVAAERGNGVGIDGIAPAVRIMSLRTVPNGDERDKDVANAIRYAVDNGAHVINMSFGKSHSPQKGAVDEAVRYAEGKGVLLVHAAGNDASDLETEGNFPNRYLARGDTGRLWIEVGATSHRGADSLVAGFSNYGRTKVDVFAPGDDILSTVPNGGYKELGGTSMAAPVVSGIAAMLMAYYPELSARDVRDIILASATRYADQQVLIPGGEGRRVAFGTLSNTGGVVNAYEALRLAAQRAGNRR